VSAAVDPQQHAGARIAIAPPSMPRRPSFSWGRDPGIAQDPVHAGNRELQALVLGQYLGEVVLVEPHVLGFGQLAHPGCQRSVQGMDRAPSRLPWAKAAAPST
jgi:hypothetical protein